MVVEQHAPCWDEDFFLPGSKLDLGFSILRGVRESYFGIDPRPSPSKFTRFSSAVRGLL
jgi:hypothetical protein